MPKPVYYLAMKTAHLVFNGFYRSPMMLEHHDQRWYWDYFLFEADGIANLITHGDSIPELRLRLRDGLRVRKGVFIINGSALTVKIAPDRCFQGVIIDPDTVCLTINDDLWEFSSSVIYKLVSEPPGPTIGRKLGTG